MNYKSRIPATMMAVLTRTRTLTRTGFLIFALCSLAIVSSSVADQTDEDQPIPVAVYDTFKRVFPPTPGFQSSWAGVFRSIIGTHVATGTSRMDVNVTDGIARCRFTWVRADGHGTLVVRSVCVLADGHGTWHVESGTGRYEHFKAVGTQTFGRISPPTIPDGFDNFERFAGLGTDDEHGDDGDDEHGGNQ